MVKRVLRKLDRPKPGFFNYFTKAILALFAWLFLFGLVYANIRFGVLTQADGFPKLLGEGFLLAILVISAGVGLFFLDYQTFFGNKRLALVAVVFLLTGLFFEIVLLAPLNVYLIPIAGMAMLLTLLLNLRSGLVISLILSLAFGLIMQARIDLFLTMFLGASAAVIATRNVRRRNQLLNAGILSGVVNFFVIACLGLYQGGAETIYLKDAMWGFGGGIVSAFLATGLLSVFEMVFNITTNITLLELSDLNNPLLKQLVLKAPGTYHHSLIVGNLAEAACDAIGANSLLGRVGAYYHDVGKIEKAEYFSENEIEVKSRHDGLTPSMSALIIVNHVKDGIDLARRHKLPRAIIDFIAQHHGTGLIYFFYQRALEKLKDETFLKEDDYRYNGPKPQTKEAAIVLLADAVEASSRTLEGPTPARITSLTQRIINNKFIDGQLDDCELSLKDLHKIAESFSKILTGIFHSRVEYPAVSSSST